MFLVIIEAIFIGLYSLFIGLFIDIIDLQIPIYIKLFIIGYIKHIIGYYLNLHTYFCNNGYACINTNKTHKIAINDYLLIDSFYDSILFVIFGLLLISIIKYKYIYYFLIGFIAHISSEYFLFHKYFCNNRCI